NKHFYSNKYDAGLSGRAYKNNSTVNDVLLDNIITYDNQFDNHGLKITLVSGYNSIEYESTSAEGLGISNLNLSYNSLQQSVNRDLTSGGWEESSIYQMGRLNYDFNDRYLFTATVRRDGYSGFS